MITENFEYSYPDICIGCKTQVFSTAIIEHPCLIIRYSKYEECPCCNCVIKVICTQICEKMVKYIRDMGMNYTFLYINNDERIFKR